MLLLLDVLSYMIGYQTAPSWLPLIAGPCILIGIIAALIKMLASGTCTCPVCMACGITKKNSSLSK